MLLAPFMKSQNLDGVRDGHGSGAAPSSPPLFPLTVPALQRPAIHRRASLQAAYPNSRRAHVRQRLRRQQGRSRASMVGEVAGHGLESRGQRRNSLDEVELEASSHDGSATEPSSMPSRRSRMWNPSSRIPLCWYSLVTHTFIGVPPSEPTIAAVVSDSSLST